MEEISLLDLITRDKAIQAFQRAKDDINIEEGNLVMIQEDNYDKALDFVWNSFLQSEPVAHSVNMGWNSELQELCISAFKHNLSFMLINKENDEVMGLRMMQIMKHDDKMDVDQFEDPRMKKIIGFWLYTEQISKFFQHFDVKEALHFFGLGVAEKYRRRGIGTKLMDFSLHFVRNLEIFPICIKGEASSNFSKKIYEKLGLSLLAEVSFDEYRKNGEVVICNTGEHKSIKLYGNILTK